MNIETKPPQEFKPVEIREFKGNFESDEIDYRNVLKDQLGTIKSEPLSLLRAENDRWLDERPISISVRPDADTLKESAKEDRPPLTDEQKQQIKEETDWSEEIVDAIGSWEEYEVYKKAGLVEAEINGKKCLIRSDIDMNQKDEFGRTNKERMEQGLAPIAKNGETIELHHIGQKPDSPLAELTTSEHRGKGNDSILHDKSKESEIDRVAFQKEKEGHWETRAGQN